MLINFIKNVNIILIISLRTIIQKIYNIYNIINLIFINKKLIN